VGPISGLAVVCCSGICVTPRSEFDDKQRRALFSAGAQAYGDGRPGYPPEVFEHLRASCGLGPGCRVLEIGPGTGQASGPLLDSGASVFAVEVGEELGRRLRAKYESRDLEVRLDEFETVDLPSEAFDLVAAATSFHWVPPQLGLDRVARVLRPGGSVALWWNHFGDTDRVDPFRDAVQPLLRRDAPQLADSSASGGAGIGAHPYALDVRARTEEINGNSRFGPVEHVLTPWTATQTTEQVRLFLSSFSQWMALENTVRTDLLGAILGLVDDAFGGIVHRPFLTAVYTAQRL
jgi:SAM-dependent methyltransferase